MAFLKESNAVALFPGGFGTLDEAMETLTLIQTGKRNPMPLVLIDEPDGTYWSLWQKFFEDELLAQGYLSPSDFNLFERVNSVDAAVECINRFYRRYHSQRFVDKKLVIRLTSEISPQAVKELKERFSDILTCGGDICVSPSLPEEADEEQIAGLPRLVVDFNRKDFGRLREFIDAVNCY